MPNNFTILTETTCDLPQSYTDEHNVVVIPMIYTLDGVEYGGLDNATMSPHDFYTTVKQGKMPKTVQVTPDVAAKFFEEEVKKGNEVLYLCFSSGLSGTYQSALIAKEEIEGKYPDAKIFVIDTLAASLGQGLFVDWAVKKRDAGLSAEECYNELLSEVQNLCHYFTVDDLNHLYRGGRVSKTAAVFGTMLGIKPVLYVDEEGHLIPIAKVRGRRQALTALVDKMATKIEGYDNPYCFISHGDCIEDAKFVADLVKKRFGIKTEVINFIGPIIGTHSGQGTVALFFRGSDRIEKKL